MRSLEKISMGLISVFVLGCTQLPTSQEPRPVVVVDGSNDPYAVTDGRGNKVVVRMNANSPTSTSDSETAATPSTAPAEESIAQRELKAVYFGVDEADLTEEAKRELSSVVVWIKEGEGRSVTVEAFADKPGTEAYNQRLSESRGARVKQYLTEQGVQASRISVVGKGENPGTDRKAIIITN